MCGLTLIKCIAFLAACDARQWAARAASPPPPGAALQRVTQQYTGCTVHTDHRTCSFWGSSCCISAACGRSERAARAGANLGFHMFSCKPAGCDWSCCSCGAPHCPTSAPSCRRTCRRSATLNYLPLASSVVKCLAPCPPSRPAPLAVPIRPGERSPAAWLASTSRSLSTYLQGRGWGGGRGGGERGARAATGHQGAVPAMHVSMAAGLRAKARRPTQPLAAACPHTCISLAACPSPQPHPQARVTSSPPWRLAPGLVVPAGIGRGATGLTGPWRMQAAANTFFHAPHQHVTCAGDDAPSHQPPVHLCQPQLPWRPRPAPACLPACLASARSWLLGRGPPPRFPQPPTPQRAAVRCVAHRSVSSTISVRSSSSITS